MIHISLTKVLALISPVVATIAGVIADWLVVHVHLLATFHVSSSAVAQAISQAVVFGVTSLGTFLIAHKVLGGLIDIVKLDHQASLQRGTKVH